MENATSTNKLTKYWFHYVITLPAMLLILIFKIIPLVNSFILPFIEYKVSKNILDSPWVGFDNFVNIFNNPYWTRVLTNTLILKLSFIVATSIVAIIASLALSSITSKKLKNFFSSLFLLPHFIPVVVFAYITIYILSQSTSPFFRFDTVLPPLINKKLFKFILTLVETLRNFGIPTIIAAAAIQYKKQSGIKTKLVTSIKAVSAFALIQISILLTLNFEMINLLYNPLVYETADTLSTFTYKVGLMQSSFSRAGAIDLIRFIVHIPCIVFVYLLLKNFFKKDLFNSPTKNIDSNKTKNTSNIPGIIISLIISIPIFIMLFMIFIYPFIAPDNIEAANSINNSLIVKSFITYGIITLFAVIVNAIITITLAYPMTVKDLPGRSIYKIFLILILTFGSYTMSEYIFFKKIGMVSTFFPYIITGFFTIINVFVLKEIFNTHYGNEKSKLSRAGKSEANLFFSFFIPKCIKPILALGIIQYITMWNSYRSSLLYNSNPENMSPTMLYRNMINSPSLEDPAVMKIGLIIALLSVILFFIFRKLITSEVLIGKMRNM